MPFVTIYLKPEFPPLLPLGRQQMSLQELRQLCVDRFPLSLTREGIMCGLEFVASILQSERIVGDLWIDGSFLTEKIDPDDADVVLCMQSTFADSMTPAQQTAVDWLCNVAELHGAARCHCFAITRWPEGHPDHEVGEWNYAYWLRQWGCPRGIGLPPHAELSSEPKGIAVVQLR